MPRMLLASLALQWRGRAGGLAYVLAPQMTASEAVQHRSTNTCSQHGAKQSTAAAHRPAGCSMQLVTTCGTALLALLLLLAECRLRAAMTAPQMALQYRGKAQQPAHVRLQQPGSAAVSSNQRQARCISQSSHPSYEQECIQKMA